MVLPMGIIFVGVRTVREMDCGRFPMRFTVKYLSKVAAALFGLVHAVSVDVAKLKTSHQATTEYKKPG
jgi:hypothetical protein